MTNVHEYLDSSRTIAWDSVIFERLFTESALDMLATTENDVHDLIVVCLEQPEFRVWCEELATEHDVDLGDVIRSLSRSLHDALRNADSLEE